MSAYDMDALQRFVIAEVERGCAPQLEAYQLCFDKFAEGEQSNLAKGRDACMEQEKRLSECSSKIPAVQDVAGRCRSFVEGYTRCFRESNDARACAQHIRKLEMCVRHPA